MGRRRRGAPPLLQPACPPAIAPRFPRPAPSRGRAGELAGMDAIPPPVGPASPPLCVATGGPEEMLFVKCMTLIK